MRLVMAFVESNNCTYSFDQRLPIEYESIEKAFLDFEKLAREAYADQMGSTFRFAGHDFVASSFFYSSGNFYPPEFLTIDDWFRLEAGKE